MTSKQSPTNHFRATNFEEINANLFFHAETKNMKSFEVFFSRCMTSFAAKKQFGTGVTELVFCIEKDFVASFLSLLRRLILKDKFIFVREHGLNSNDSEAWRKKKIIVHVLTRFYSNMLKIKMRNSRDRRKFEFFIGYFFEKIK